MDELKISPKLGEKLKHLIPLNSYLKLEKRIKTLRRCFFKCQFTFCFYKIPMIFNIKFPRFSIQNSQDFQFTEI